MPQTYPSSFPAPHPDCKAFHKSYWEYSGPTHACAGPECKAVEHRATAPGGQAGGIMPQVKEEHRATAVLEDQNGQHLF